MESTQPQEIQQDLLNGDIVIQNSQNEQRPAPPDNSNETLEAKNCFDKITLLHSGKIIKTGLKHPYEEKMLFQVDKDFQYSTVKDLLRQCIEATSGKLTAWSLYRYSWRYFVKILVIGIIHQITYPRWPFLPLR